MDCISTSTPKRLPIYVSQGAREETDSVWKKSKSFLRGPWRRTDARCNLRFMKDECRAFVLVQNKRWRRSYLLVKVTPRWISPKRQLRVLSRRQLVCDVPVAVLACGGDMKTKMERVSIRYRTGRKLRLETFSVFSTIRFCGRKV